MFKHIGFSLLIGFLSLSLQAQNGSYQYRGDEFYSYDEELNLYLEADYESRRGDKSQYRYGLLKVYSNTDNGLTEIQSHSLGEDIESEGSYRFDGEFNTFSRRFVILQGQYSFYLYDLKGRSLKGPFQPYFWGTSEEKDKGRIERLLIGEQGQFVYGLSKENGCFMYDFRQLDSGRELLPSNIPFFSYNRVYAVSDLKNYGQYNIVFLSEEQGEVLLEELFSDLRIQAENREFLINLSEEEKEERIMTASPVENRYTLFKESSGTAYKVVDVFMGKAVELPAEKQFSEESEIYEYLSGM